jgi:addiction module RelE/StbE family toxin
MNIRFHRFFSKRYKKLSPVLQKKVDKTIQIFIQNPHARELYNHGLVGSLIGKRSISVTGDVRIIFAVEGNYITVLFLDVGTHAQLY